MDFSWIWIYSWGFFNYIHRFSMKYTLETSKNNIKNFNYTNMYVGIVASIPNCSQFILESFISFALLLSLVLLPDSPSSTSSSRDDLACLCLIHCNSWHLSLLVIFLLNYHITCSSLCHLKMSSSNICVFLPYFYTFKTSSVWGHTSQSSCGYTNFPYCYFLSKG